MRLKLITVLSVFFLFTFNNSFSQTADAGSDQEICTNATTLAAVPAPSGYIGTWTVISGACTIDNNTLHNTTVTGLLNNFNELKWTITNGTITDADEVIITNNYPTQAVTASDEEICENTFTLNGSAFGPGETGLWDLSSGSGTLATPTFNICDITGLASGNNILSWTISKGICSSTDDILITNNTVFADAGTDDTICEDFISLNAVNPTLGTGTWTVVASDGFPVFGNINVFNTTITGLGPNTNSLQWTVVYGTCSEYDNVIITSDKPTIANAGTDQITCVDHTILAGNNPVEGNGEWTIVFGNGTFADLNAYNSQVTVLDNFANIFKWTISKNGCTSEDDVEIYYDYFVSDAGTDDVTCTDSYTLNANSPAPGTGEWRVIGGTGTFVNANLNTTEVSDLIVGENTFEWEITRGACTETNYVVITRNTASTADAGSDIEICNGTTTLAATNPTTGTGLWTVTSGTGTFANASQNNTGVTNVGLDENIYRWTVDYIGCNNYDEITVTNNYVHSDAGLDQIVCGTTSILEGNEPQAGETGEWLILAGTSSVSDINLYNSTVNSLNSDLNKYRWTISKGNCSDFDEIEITNNLYNATANLSGPSDICEDFTAIVGNSPPSGGTAIWSAQSGTGYFDNSNDQSTVVRNLSLGENIIRWTIIKDGCANFDEITINRNTIFADAGTDQVVCEDYSTLSAVPVSGNLTGIWSVGGGSSTVTNPSSANSGVTGLTNGLNSFIWTVSGNGCSDDDIVEIINNMFFTSAGTNQEICESFTTIEADDPTPGTGYWGVISGTGIFTNTSNFNTTVTNILDNSVNVYRWNAHENGCNAFDDLQVTNNFVSSDAGTDIIVCTNFTNLSATEPEVGIGGWSVQFGAGTFADANSASTLVSNINLNENIYRWTVSNLTCSDFNDVSVTNNFISSSAGGDQELCTDYTLLSAQAPPTGGIGNWELVSGFGSITNPSLYNTEITNLQSGFSTFKWTIFKNGCESVPDEVSINNNSFTADAGEDQSLEDFVTSTFLSATLPENATGEWMLVGGGGNIITINDPSTEVTNMPTGINTFMWTVTDFCTSYDYVEITVIDFHVNPGINRTICSDFVQLNAANYTGATQSWSLIEGTGDFADPNLYNTWVNNISIGTNIYRWTVTQSGATSYADVIVTQIFAEAGEDQLVCINDIDLTANIPNNNCTGLWSIVSGSGNIISPTLNNTEVQNIDFLNNIFQWSVISSECIINDYVYVYNDMVIAEAGEDQEIETSDTFMDAVAPFNTDTKLWTVLSGSGNFTDATDPKTYVEALSLGDNIFRWTISNENCSDFDDITITNNYGISIKEIENHCKIYPNPNTGVFSIDMIDDTDYNIELIDIFGKLIYKETEISKKYKQLDISSQSAGVYFLNIKSKNINKTIKIVKE